ncbi:MAG: hypothetical protein JXB20_02645 [Bacilli bacterium]|nr:hypothetical protein [Bacilli bacterium]MBN2695970.1 hypothetical protein [Bacilli bacterium]
MQGNQKRFLGILLIVFGVIFLLDRLGILPVNVFFQGWWTLLLILPAIYSMTKQGVTAGNSILLAIGVFFFLDENGWNIKGFVIPSILIIFGIALLIRRS